MKERAEAVRPTVLVGFAEAASAPEVAWSLVDAGFNVVAFARKGRSAALRRSRHVVCHEIRSPEEDVSGALSDMRSLLADTGGDGMILFPLDDTAVWLCSRLELPPGWLLAGPSGDAAEVALNKSRQVEFAARTGFNVPLTSLVHTARDLYGAVGSYPVILKGAQCLVQRESRLHGCRTWICADREELERACGEWAERVPLLVQPFIEGVGEGVFGLATLDGVRAWSGHRRLRMMNPQGSGASACVSQHVPDDLKRAAEAFIEQTRWRGLFMIELLREPSGRVWFVELNGRPWGSMALARRQGLEYPAWQVRLALDGQSAAGREQTGGAGVVCRHVGRELLHTLFVFRGPKSKALRKWPSAWRALASVLSVRRGDRFYNWRTDDPAVFVSDCYYTVHDQLIKIRH